MRHKNASRVNWIKNIEIDWVLMALGGVTGLFVAYLTIPTFLVGLMSLIAPESMNLMKSFPLLWKSPLNANGAVGVITSIVCIGILASAIQHYRNCFLTGESMVPKSVVIVGLLLVAFLSFCAAAASIFGITTIAAISAGLSGKAAITLGFFALILFGFVSRN